MIKIGEQQVQRMFSEHLGETLRNRFGEKIRYAYGEFNGMQDKKYADYFAGVNSSNIIIEFKEFFSEINDERRKALRENLCKNIPDYLIETSYLSHHISWRGDSSESIVLAFDRYLSRVCPIFDIEYERFKVVGVSKFIDDFLDKRIGAGSDDFADYVDYLAELAGDEGSSFFGVLLSFDPKVGLKNTIFYNLEQLVELAGGNTPNSTPPPPKPRGPSGSGGMSPGP